MAKFPFRVKLNGVVYEAGMEVPIGKEPAKEVEMQDKTATELSKELKERFGIDMAAQKGKAKLEAALKEAEEAEKKRAEESTEEDDEVKENEEDIENEGEGSEDNEDSTQDENDSFLDKIINE